MKFVFKQNSRKTSPRVEQTNEPLGLIHIDLCDLKYL